MPNLSGSQKNALEYRNNHLNVIRNGLNHRANRSEEESFLMLHGIDSISEH
jgi:hypothetical protein